MAQLPRCAGGVTFRLGQTKRDMCALAGAVQLRAYGKLETRGTEKFSAFMRKFNSELTHVGTININLPKIFRVIYNSGGWARRRTRARALETTDNGAAGELRILNLQSLPHTRVFAFAAPPP